VHCEVENIPFKILLLDNAPGYPQALLTSREIKLNTISLVLPIYQGAVATSKTCYIFQNFFRCIKYTDGRDESTVKEFW
jgi:hypothetical protein